MDKSWWTPVLQIAAGVIVAGLIIGLVTGGRRG